MSYFEMLQFIAQTGEFIDRKVRDERGDTEVWTDKYRYVRSVENGRYVWVRWASW